MRIKDIPIFIFLSFTLIYSLFGDSKSEAWSGCYFFVHYLTMFMLFKRERNKVNRLFGMSLSISVIIFLSLKYFLKLEIDRLYSIIPFLICLIFIYKKEIRE